MGTEGQEDENLNDMMVTNQQNNYIMSKQGDTVDEFLEDGITHTQREAKSLPNKLTMMSSEQSMKNQDIEEFKTIL